MSDEKKFPEPVVVTVATKAKGTLTKHLKINPETDELIKDSSNCSLGKGKVKKYSVTSIYGMAKMLRWVEPNMALIHGISDHNEASLVKKSMLGRSTSGQLPTIARTKEYFQYSDGPGLFMLDHDAARTNAVGDSKALSAYKPAPLMEVISGVLGAFLGVAWVSTPSTSSCIYGPDGAVLRDEGNGAHIYLFAKQASDIPRFLDVLGKRLILAGFGRIEISRAGSLLIRTLVDLTVGSPERLDFVAGAVCHDGLEQRLPDPTVVDGEMLDTTVLKDLSAEEEGQYKEIVDELKERAKPGQATVRSAYIEVETAKLVDARGIDIDDARSVIKLRQRRTLPDDDVLYFNHLKEGVIVGEALDAGEEYHNKSLADPLEPDYEGGSTTKAIFFWNGGNPLVHSFAHGGQKYTFSRYKSAGRKNEQTDTIPKSPSKILERYAVQTEYVDGLGNEEFLYDNILIKNHILVIIAESGGGKTTFLYFNVCREISRKGFNVWYIDADSPPSDHKRMKDFADEHGIKFLIPDVNKGMSVASLVMDLESMAESQADLKNFVFVFDTLKKFIDLMSKQSAKDFFILMRKLTKLGASVVLPGHANKHRDSDGNLVFEGVGDVRSDCDDLIFFEKVKKADGSLDITTIVDSDRGAKIRGIFKSMSFNIDKSRQITFYAKPLNLIDLANTGAAKASDEDIVTAAEKYLKSRGDSVSQTHLVGHVLDVVQGQAGKNRVRSALARRAVMEGDDEPYGTRFVYTVGERNTHLYELPKQPPEQVPMWGDEADVSI